MYQFPVVNWLEIEKYTFSYDIQPFIAQSTRGNNYHRNIVSITKHFAYLKKHINYFLCG